MGSAQRRTGRHERYAGHRVWEGTRGTFPFWQRHRCTGSKTFPRLHVVLAGKAEYLLDNRLQGSPPRSRGSPSRCG